MDRHATAGLTASAGIAGWVEFLLLRHNLNQRIGKTGLTAEYTMKLWIAALSGLRATNLEAGIRSLFSNGKIREGGKEIADALYGVSMRGDGVNGIGNHNRETVDRVNG